MVDVLHIVIFRLILANINILYMAKYKNSDGSKRIIIIIIILFMAQQPPIINCITYKHNNLFFHIG